MGAHLAQMLAHRSRGQLHLRRQTCDRHRSLRQNLHDAEALGWSQNSQRCRCLLKGAERNPSGSSSLAESVPHFEPHSTISCRAAKSKTTDRRLKTELPRDDQPTDRIG